MQEDSRVLTDMSHPGQLWNTKPLALQDFLSGLILFIFVIISSPHHFRWCEKNAFNAHRKKRGCLKIMENSQISPGFSFDLLILTPGHIYTQMCI